MEQSTFMRHVEAMRSAEIIGCDTESTGLRVKDGRDYGVGISVAYRLGPLGIMSAYFPIRHPDGNIPPEWVPHLADVLADKPLVFHNAKHDLHTLRGMGIRPKGRIYCTMMLAHMWNEELPSKELDYLAKRFLKKEKLKKEVDAWTDMFGWGAVPVQVMAPYATADAELHLELFEYLWPKVKDQELHTLWPTERAFVHLLTRVEATGVRVNTEFAKQKAYEGRNRMGDVLELLDVEEDTLGPKALKRILIDVLGLPVIKVSEKTGKPSFDKKVMKEYDEILAGWDAAGTDNADLARLVLEYRGWQKAVTSLYEPLLEKVSPDGRIRANFKQHGTRTGRLSCSEPNLQQIPRKSAKPWNGDAKRSFDSTDGWELYGYDYSQLEFRLAAAYGREQWLIEEFSKPDGDVFTAMAERAGVARDTIKTYTYATLYGAGLNKIALTMGKRPDEIKDSFEAFKASISGIRYTSEMATKRAAERGYVRYWSGRRRHFPFNEGHHKAFNSLLQGGGAELVKQAMINIDNDEANIPHNICRIVLQVHDEIVFEIKHGYREQVEPHIIRHMGNFPQFGVPLKVEGKVWNQ